MDMSFKSKAYFHANEFESIYSYSDQYKVVGNPTVWKFMDLEKFESMLKNKSLFFAKPSAFIDPLEGSYSKFDVDTFEEKYSVSNLTSREYMKKIQDFSAISCWHMNDYESAGMWDLYLSGKDGIAIKTNYKNLLKSINDLRYLVFSGAQQYIDFKTQMTSRNIYDTLFYKRKSFSHENELRLMIIASRLDQEYLQHLYYLDGVPEYAWEQRIEEMEVKSYEFSNDKGNFVSCDLNKLLEEIYISPNSKPEVVERVKRLVAKYNLSEKVVNQSDLYHDYIY